MPGITVEELWRGVLPPGTEMLAGAIGLDREVSWPVTLRTRAPALPSLKGGELALISIESLRLLDPPLQLATVLRSLAGFGAAGAAILGEVGPEARELANSIGLPVLSLPGGTHIADLEHTIARSIVDRRTELHQRSQEIFRRLTELAIEGRGVDAILETIADLTGKDVVLEEQDFTLGRHLARAHGGDPTAVRLLRADADRIGAWLGRTALSASEPPTLRLPVGDALARVIAPIAIKDAVLGYLSLLGPRGSLSDVDELAVSRGAAALAIELARDRAVSEAEDRLQADFVESLVTGAYASVDAIQSRAHRLGFDLNQAFSAIVFGLDSDAADPLSARRLRLALEREANGTGVRGPIGARGDRAILLVPQRDEPAALKSLAEELRAALSAGLEASISAGVGRVHGGIEGIRLTFQEADGALSLGRRVLGNGQVAHFGELGLYRLLLALRSTAELESFYDDTLGALAERDRRSDGELVRTLDAYFACLGSPTEAAERLHVHRNTLLYRLRKIQEIAGVDLGDAETRLALHLALRVRDVLQVDERPSGARRFAQSPVR
ncbi:MAG TPA: helix-turn-helix domain-containing protein [Chloroflexota bacterium]